MKVGGRKSLNAWVFTTTAFIYVQVFACITTTVFDFSCAVVEGETQGNDKGMTGVRRMARYTRAKSDRASVHLIDSYGKINVMEAPPAKGFIETTSNKLCGKGTGSEYKREG